MMSESVSPILQWLNANPHLAGLATFIISAAESIAIIGTIIPGSVTMTAIGALMGAGIIPFWSTLIWAILGAIVGDGISYWMGYYFKDRIHYIWPFRKHPNILKTGEDFFDKYGGLSVFIGRFTGPVRALVPLVAGMLRVTPLRFTIANVTSAILWAPAYMLPGIILGAASMELPSEIATRAILMFVMTCLLVALFFWLIKKLLLLISAEIDQFLAWIWDKLARSQYFYILTRALKHHKSNKTYGQLALAFYFTIIVIALLYLMSFVHYKGSDHILINNMVFHFFRTVRSPSADTVMFCITLLGEKYVLLPLIITLFGWLALKKYWHTAFHVLSLGIITTIGIEAIKHYVKSPRPWGVLSNSLASFSFPSGHTTLALVFYFGITFLVIQLFQLKSRKLFYIPATLLITSIAISRLYFGVHWLTDIIGGVLVGSAALILITLSYHRKAEKQMQPKGILLTIVLTLFITYSINLYYNYHKLTNEYAMLEWPTKALSFETWWSQSSDHFPLHLYNRVGLAPKLFNLQWLDQPSSIQTLLLKNGWALAPKNDWITVLYRVTSVQSTEHLPLVSPIYLDKYPIMILTKHINHKLILLRLWQSPFYIENSALPLWVGTVEYAPSTYSWLFNNKRANPLLLESTVLFEHTPQTLDIKIVTHIGIYRKQLQTQPILLIKPKTVFNH